MAYYGDQAEENQRPSFLTILVALAIFPNTLLLISLHFLYKIIAGSFGFIRALIKPSTSRAPRKVLITSASSAAGVSTARILHASGHAVVAADFEAVPYSSCARASRSVQRFYSLSLDGSLTRAGLNASETDYFSSSILHIVEHERPDLWIHCGSSNSQFPDAETIAAAKERIEQSSHCRVLYPTTATLRTLTDEVQFAQFVNSLDAGLSAPEVRNVFSRGEIHRVLGSWPMKRRFVLEKLDPESVAEVQSTAAESPSLSRRTSQRPSRPASMISSSSNLTGSTLSVDWHNGGRLVDEYAELDALILPSTSMSDTYDRIASIKVSKTEPWSLQEIVRGEQFVAYTLIIRGQLAAFVLKSEERRQSGIVHSGAMHDRILEFMRTAVQSLPPNTSTHLNVRFVLSETTAARGVQQALYPVSADVESNGPLFLYGESASPSSHAAWRLSRLYYAAMFESHASALAEGRMGNGIAGDYRRLGVLSVPLPKNESDSLLRLGHYSLPPSVLHLLVVPLVELVMLHGSLAEVVQSGSELLSRLAYEKEEFFDWQDPWPWIWTWSVGMPLQTLARVGGHA